MADAVATTDTTKRNPKDTFLAEVHKRWQRCVDADKENRDRALEALKFRNLEQWDDKVRKDRENDPEGARPCLVLDKLNQHVNQVVNDERQNRPQIKVRPVDDVADPETAKVFDGIIRHIQDQSRADIAYDTAFEHAVDGGFGYWRITTEFCDEMSFEQDARINRVRNRFAVYLDPDRQEPDGSDAKFGFVVDKYQTEDFKRDFKDAEPVSFETDGKTFKDWCGQEWVLVAEHFWIEPKRMTIVLLADEEGTVLPKEDYLSDKAPEVCFQRDVVSGQIMLDRDGKPVRKPIQKERETIVNRVLWRKITAKEIIDPPASAEVDETSIVKAADGQPARLWAGKWIPIVEVIGNELDIEGKAYRSGVIRGAMDPQRVYNYSGSSFVENVALAPRAPWTAAEGQIEGYEELYRTANRRNLSVLPYKATEVNGVLVPPPQRQMPPGISAGWQQAMLNAEHDIESSLGRYAATLGAPSNEKSGRAILARNREGDVGTFHFQDNLTRSMQHTGRILVDLVPKLYDTKRIARIIGEDGKPDQITIDPDLKDEETGKKVAYQERKTDSGIEKIYNPTVGKYDVTVIVGPAYTTRRQEAAEAMLEVSRGNPEFMGNFGDIIFESQDWPGADRIAARFKKLNPAAVDDDDKNAEVIQTPKGPIPKEQAGQLIMQLTEQLETVMADDQRVKEQNKNLDLQVRAKELLQRDEEIAIQKAEAATKQREAEVKAAEAASRVEHTEAQTDHAEVSAMAAAQQVEATAALSQAAAMLAQTAQTILATSESGNANGEAVQAMLARSLETQAVMLEANARNMQALEAVIVQSMEAQMAPRKIELITDARGMPAGAVSTAVQ